MKILFFSRADKSGRSSFHSFYVFQNLKTVKTTSLIYFLFCILIRVVFFAYHLPVHAVNHLNDYDAANWIGLFMSPAFYLISLYLLGNFKKNRKYLQMAQAVCCAFALYIIISAMRATFFSMYNPRNTLVMYLMGLFITAVFFSFEYYQTIFITVVSGIIFSIILPFYQHSFSEVLLNNLASLILLTAFFCTSRYLFSYRADNFFKLRSIEEKNTEIENASIIKNEILGVVAHDLRNPLAIIKSAAALMGSDENTNNEHSDYLQMINTSCDKATAIINDLIETAQNELHHEFELTDTNLNGFLSAIVKEWCTNKKGNINILYHDAPYAVYAELNKEKMQRVMDNLISNAIKFSSENGHIEISLTDSEDTAYIAVKDAGIGVPAEMLPYIFDRFSKARRNGIRGEVSVGLGLSIVRQIVRKHEGEIAVSSTGQNGTTFTISLPKIVI